MGKTDGADCRDFLGVSLIGSFVLGMTINCLSHFFKGGVFVSDLSLLLEATWKVVSGVLVFTPLVLVVFWAFFRSID